jgi:DNA polymerase IV
MGEVRAILHVDMDAFFASVEQLDHPELRGKPVLVGHDGPRGVVAAASYEARKFGCRSALPMSVAKRMCPQAVVVRGRHERYGEVSEQVFEIFEKYTPAVEGVSIDEAFLDVSGCLRLHGTAEEIGWKIKREIFATTGLTASVGVAGNKFLAKLASDMNKPDGFKVIRAEDVEKLLAPMAVGRIYGIGPKTAAMLEGIGIKTIADLRAWSVEALRGRLGEAGEEWQKLAWGMDEREVISERGAKSISHEETFEVDVGSPEVLQAVLIRQVEAVGYRLRRHGQFARRVGLKIRYGDFKTVSRSRTLREPTNHTRELLEAALGLWEEWVKAGFVPVRLIGMGAEALGPAEKQLGLFADPAAERDEKLDAAVDEITRKFGKGSVQRGV